MRNVVREGRDASSSVSVDEKAGPSKLLLLGLLSAVFAVNVIDVFVPLLLPEISAAFHVSRGVASTLTAFGALAGVVTGFALSALSVRIRYKTLLLLGVLTTPICVLGVYFASSFFMAQVFYSLNGVGSAIVAVMAPTLIAEMYPLNKKAVRISWIVSTSWIALLVANPITGYLSSSGNVTSWSNSLLWFLLPVTVVSAFMVILFIPSKSSITRQGVRKEPFVNSFREILSNRSAVACLVNSFLGGAWLAAGVYHASFIADVFGASPALRGTVALLGVGALIMGTLVGGFLVNPIGRKLLFVSSAVSAVLLVFLSYAIAIIIPDMWLGVGLRTVSGLLGGFVFVAGPNLYLEQVPKYRGTLMSLGQGIGGIGRAVGVFVAGGVLALYGSTVIGYSTEVGALAAIGIAGASVILLFAKDPCKNQPKA